MTAIFAACSHKYQVAALASDDIDSNHIRTDKIALLKNRFAIAVNGHSSLYQALFTMGSFQHFTNYRVPDTLRGIIEESFHLALEIYKHKTKNLLLTSRKNMISKPELYMRSSLIALDIYKYELYEIDLGQLFSPDRKAITFNIDPLEDSKLHRIGYAASRSATPEELEYSDIKDLNTYIRNKFQDTKAITPEMGNLGTLVLTEGKKIEISTCFRNTMDYLRVRLSVD